MVFPLTRKIALLSPLLVLYGLIPSQQISRVALAFAA